MTGWEFDITSPIQANEYALISPFSNTSCPLSLSFPPTTFLTITPANWSTLTFGSRARIMLSFTMLLFLASTMPGRTITVENTSAWVDVKARRSVSTWPCGWRFIEYIYVCGGGVGLWLDAIFLRERERVREEKRNGREGKRKKGKEKRKNGLLRDVKVPGWRNECSGEKNRREKAKRDKNRKRGRNRAWYRIRIKSNQLKSTYSNPSILLHEPQRLRLVSFREPAAHVDEPEFPSSLVDEGRHGASGGESVLDAYGAGGGGVGMLDCA